MGCFVSAVFGTMEWGGSIVHLSVKMKSVPCRGAGDGILGRLMTFLLPSRPPLRKHHYPVKPSFSVHLVVPAQGGGGTCLG